MLSLKIWLTAVILSLAVISTPGVAASQELGSTLQKIKDTGAITIGYREGSVPFSYMDKNQPIGYAMEYTLKIIEAVKAKLGMPGLQVNRVPVTGSTRIPMLTKAEYDFECGTTTNTKARQEQVTFSNTFFISSTRFLVDKNSGIKDIADLKGKNVVVSGGTTSETLLYDLNDKDKLGINVISAKDYADAMANLESGKAVAFLLDDILLAGEAAKSANPNKWVIVGTPLSFEAYGCMMRRGDNNFKSLVDKVVADAQTSGDAEKWFKQWLQQPIPPNNINMKFEMSDAVRTLFKTPNDKPFQ